MKGVQSIRTALVLLTAAIGLQAPAHAGTRPVVDAELSQLTRNYLDAYRKEDRTGAKSRLFSTLHSTKIQQHLFAHVGTEFYITELQYLDSWSATDAPALFDLARKLQFHWEASYAAGIGQRASQRRAATDIGTKAGASMGMFALGVMLIKSPQNAPKYVRIVRHLLPLTGATIGNLSGRAWSSQSVLAGDAPPAPAHLMSLGLAAESEEKTYDEDALFKDFVAISSGVAAGAAATELFVLLRAARAINLAATPAKINPLVLAGSLVVGLGVEYGVRAGIHQQEESTLRADITTTLATLDRAISEQDQAQVLVQGERFKRAILNLSLWMWKPVIELSQSFQEEAASLLERHSIDSPEFSQRLESATRSYRQDLRWQLADYDNYYDSMLETHVILSYLRSHNQDAISQLTTATARTRASLISSNFEAWIESQEDEKSQCFDDCTRERLFLEYLTDMQRAQQTRHAREFRKGTTRKHPTHVLLQGAAVLASAGYGTDLLSPLADELLALVDKNEEIQMEARILQ